MKQVVLVSGKGGTGKTVITAAFAHLAKNKVMADCDVDAADLHILLDPEIIERHDFIGGKTASINNELCDKCGICAMHCRFDAIDEDAFVVDPISCIGCAVCFSVCPQNAVSMLDNRSGEWYISNTRYGILVHAKLGIAEENSGKLVTLVRQNAKLIAEQSGSDIILIDGPPGISCPVISSITGTDAVIIVTEPTLSGLHDMTRVSELANHFKIKSFVIINKFDLNLHMSNEIETYCRSNGILCVGTIPFDPVVTEALVNRKNIIEYSNGALSDCIRTIWSTIEHELL